MQVSKEEAKPRRGGCQCGCYDRQRLGQGRSFGGLAALHKDTLGNVVNVLSEGGSMGEALATTLQIARAATVEVAKRNECDQFAVIPQCWEGRASSSNLKMRFSLENAENQRHSRFQRTVLAFLALFLKKS